MVDTAAPDTSLPKDSLVLSLSLLDLLFVCLFMTLESKRALIMLSETYLLAFLVTTEHYDS